jgi:hypothetical protein
MKLFASAFAPPDSPLDPIPVFISTAQSGFMLELQIARLYPTAGKTFGS